MNRKASILSLLILILLSIWQIADSVAAQQSPLTLAEILTGLQTNGRTAETNTLAKRNVYIAKRVRERKVSFTLTSERERDLRDAGATNELIEVIRQNSPRLPTPSKTPTPVKTPTPNPIKNQPFTGKTFRNSIGMQFVLIPSGTFLMGSPTNEKERNNGEKQHQVTISREFYIGQYEVTQGQWKVVMGNNPSSHALRISESVDRPIESVSWNDVQEFIKRLNAKNEGKYRLPTEAEWEYAARAGTKTPFGIGDGYNLSSTEAHFDARFPYGNALQGERYTMTREVGDYLPNAWKLYDMHGNVWEWCNDWSGEYTNGSVTDPTGPTTGSYRIMRGGSYKHPGMKSRSAFRAAESPSSSNSDLGFRLVRE